MPVDGKARARQRRSAQRAFIHPRARIGKPRAVARDHLDIGHHVVAPGHRLRGLQMGEARHHPIGARLGLRQQRAHQRGQRRNRRIALIAHPKPEIGCHLIVARPRRMQAPGGLANDLLQPRLDVHVNVFKRGREREIARLDL